MCCRSACREADGHTNFEIGIGVTLHTMSPDISEKVILMSQDALIENVMEQIMGVWQVDAKDLRGRGPKGFDWLPNPILQTIPQYKLAGQHGSVRAIDGRSQRPADL